MVSWIQRLGEERDGLQRDMKKALAVMDMS